MISEHSKSVAKRAKSIYDNQLRTQLEANHPNRFVAIEPESAEYFIAESFGEAVAASRDAYPDRISFVIRIGHEGAIHLGGVST